MGGLARLGNISSFGVDSDGELYIVSYSNGTILKVTGPPSALGRADGIADRPVRSGASDSERQAASSEADGIVTEG